MSPMKPDPLLPVYDTATDAGRRGLEERLAALRATASPSGDAARTVADVMADVRLRGDDAVVDYMREWTDPAFSAERLRVTDRELDRAEAALNGELRDAIKRAIANVRAYQQHVMPADAGTVTVNGAELGLRWTPVDRVGLCVPGGTAVLFSTLIMLAVPALVAGVAPENISVMSPPPTRREGAEAGDISPLVLAVCRLLGIESVYRLGGAQGVAALGYGTETVGRVDLIAGPGNVFVQLAKARLGAACGTDNGFYGPSEIVTVADETADPARVASDLIAQAEHDPGKCFLIAWQDPACIDAVVAEIERQLVGRNRILKRSRRRYTMRRVSVRVADRAAAVAIDTANRFRRGAREPGGRRSPPRCSTRSGTPARYSWATRRRSRRGTITPGRRTACPPGPPPASPAA